MINFYDTVLSYNKQAMIALKNGQVAVAFNLLDQAERILRRKNVQGGDRLLSLTFNNLGCFYRKTGDYSEAIKVFNKAILENRSDSVSKAGTYLNLSNVYSILIQHEKALSCACQALEILKATKDKTEDYKFTLLTAYSNIATEQEHLSQYTNSEEFYKKALKLARKHFPSHDFSEKIHERYRILQGKLTTVLLDSNSFRDQRRFNSYTPKPQARLTKHEKKGSNYWEKTVQKRIETRGNSENSHQSNKSNIVSGRFLLFSKISSGNWNEIGKKEKRKSVGLRVKKVKAKRNRKVVSKTPEVVPVPFRNKLLLFNSYDN